MCSFERIARSGILVTVCVHVCVCLTALCDVTDAAVNYDRYVCVGQLLLTQRSSTTPCSGLNGSTPASKIQLPFSLYVQSSKREEGWGVKNKRGHPNRDSLTKPALIPSPAFLYQHQHLVVLLDRCNTQSINPVIPDTTCLCLRYFAFNMSPDGLFLSVPLTEFMQLAEVYLLHWAVVQVGVKRGAHQSKPAHLGCLKVQPVFAPQPPDPLDTQPEQRLCPGWDNVLQITDRALVFVPDTV